MVSIFAECASQYASAGYQPRTIRRGTKGCYAKGWQEPLSGSDLESLIRRSQSDDGIGLLMGTAFPDGSRLGAIDVDDKRYTEVVKFLLGNPPVGRIGSKGAVFFVRVRGEPRGSASSNPEFRVEGLPELGKVVECLFSKKLCVIPPTIHPDTGLPYRWIGPALLDVPFTTLPLVDLSS